MMTIQLYCDYSSGTNEPITIQIMNDADDSVITQFLTNRAPHLSTPALTTLYHIFDCTSAALDVYLQLSHNPSKTQTIFTNTIVTL